MFAGGSIRRNLGDGLRCLTARTGCRRADRVVHRRHQPLRRCNACNPIVLQKESISMKSITSLRRKPLLAALVLAGAVGFGGISLAQTQSPQGAAPNAAATPPASTSATNPADTSKMGTSSPDKSATSPAMDSKAIPPGRAETPDSAFRKLDAA